MKIYLLIVVFLLINFSGLAIGSWLMNDGPNTIWYQKLNQAPWTPPGWVFGIAWTSIMICFSIYLAYLFKWQNSRFLWLLFSFQFLLNVSWNYVFFNQHMTILGLIIIMLLLIVILYYFVTFKTVELRGIRFLLLPYLIWLCVATSLNLYIVIHNSPT